MKLIFGQQKNFKPKPLQEGEYKAKVVKSEWFKSKQYEEDINPDGWALRLWVDILNKDKRVFSTIPITKSLKLNKLRESAGLKPVGENDDFKAEHLLGKVISVRLGIYENDKKELVNVISRFVTNNTTTEDDVIPEKDEELDDDLGEEEGEFPF